MKNKILIIGLVLLIILATSITVFAITGRTQTAYDESEDTWEKFRDEMFENKKAFIEERVKDGTLTQEEADEILKNIELMQEYCLGAGGCGMGRGFGMMRNRLGNNSGYGNYGFRGMGFGGGRCGRGSW
ncbi:MAG TPA: DUF2680 domain-containing protein [Sedimentibacter sp.]|jgi:hypothetical protein|nr:DUF2680 domain-containing protein [Sedimentibacter sp.]HPY56921.1 DUF2680 domain-containing protein [Sedimentibacter sp.]HQC70863.1 DUF2680 domain-containing protein [Sedimentibacter sp.]HQK54777.1 DUF2680 domain-containing protein [Sedimentibacter sp.]